MGGPTKFKTSQEKNNSAEVYSQEFKTFLIQDQLKGHTYTKVYLLILSSRCQISERLDRYIPKHAIGNKNNSSSPTNP